MSRKSEYSDADILDIAEANGYTRLHGQHVNGESVHVLRHSCGMVNVKTSKTLLSDKRGCRFIPCHPKGLLSLLYVQSIARDEKIESVSHQDDATVALERLVISANDTLVWRKDGQTMTQSWNDVRKRALSVKKGEFFQPDGTRRKARSAKLTLEALKEICTDRGFHPPASVPTRRQHKVMYVHAKCGRQVALRFNQLEAWEASRCAYCSPPETSALVTFQSFLQDAEMTYTGNLAMNGKQVDRAQKLQIVCSACQEKNTARTYDNIRYRGFTCCDNPECQNTYPIADKASESDDYYIDLFKKNDVKYFAQAQRLFPRATRYLTRISPSTTVGGVPGASRYAYVRDSLGLDANLPSQDFSDDELQRLFQEQIDKGCRNISQLRLAIPGAVNNYINRKVAEGDRVHHRILKRIGFRFKHGYVIDSLADAIACVRDTKSSSWSAFVTRYPEAGMRVIALGFKEGVMTEFGWSPLVNYSNEPDETLLDKAVDCFRDDGFVSIAELERNYSRLVVVIRSRGLIDSLYQALGLEKPKEWQGMALDDLVRFVCENEFASLSHWHIESSGSYKYAMSQDWLREVARLAEWGEYKALNGYSYASLPETIIANLLYLSDHDFSDHPPITGFVGYGGGRPSADFLVNSNLWVEVWAYRTDDKPIGAFHKYPEVRRHKESGYQTAGMHLCSIEGGLFYRKYLIDGKNRQAGLSSFVQHACERLSQNGCPIAYSDALLNAVRKSVLNLSASVMIER